MIFSIVRKNSALLAHVLAYTGLILALSMPISISIMGDGFRVRAQEARAQTTAPQPPTSQSPSSSAAAPAAPAAADPSSATDHLFNPIKYVALADLIIGLTKIFTGAIIVVSVGFIVLGGSELVISAGNQEMIEKGRKTVTWAILGLIIALSAFSIVAIIEDLLGVH